MEKKINLDNNIITYNLEIKNVKNINLRINKDGRISVSKNKNTPQTTVDDFLISKKEFILKTLSKFEEKKKVRKTEYYTEEGIKTLVLSMCEKVYPYYEKKGISYPEIKFRKMVGRWGSCHPYKGVLTFNTNLRYAPLECVLYVIYHEFTHFLHPDHSKEFYNELYKVCPDYKSIRKKLKNIYL